MLHAGDLIDVQGEEALPQRFMVCRVDADDNVLVSDVLHRFYTIPADADGTEGCRVIGHPTTEWPFVQMPKINWVGPTEVGRARRDGSSTPLDFLFDWVLGEPLRSGGALYLNPLLKLRPLDTIVLAYDKGTVGVTIPAGFGTVAQRVQRAQPKKLPPKSIYDRLLENVYEDDE